MPDPQLIGRYGNPVETAAARAEQDQELADRFRRQKPVPTPDEPMAIAQPAREQLPVATSPARESATATSVKARKISRNAKPEWIPAGQPIEVAGYVIERGLLYVGQSRVHKYEEVEPSLLDPSLPINTRRPDYAGATFGYWPSYEHLTPEARAAYLEWLSHGRRDADVPIGFVFLFMYGLERRILTEVANNPKLAHEVPVIRNEMQELMDLHKDDYSFQSYGSGFVDILELIALQGDPDHQFVPPPLTDYRWSFPFGLKVELGSLAADAKPVSAEWALAWAWYNEGTRIRTPATRCLKEFSAIFKKLYSDAYGDGLVPRPTGRKMKISYNPASSAIPTADVSIDGISDVSESRSITKELERLADEAQIALDPYSRLLGKSSEAASSLKAQALLPADLLDSANPSVTRLRQLLEPVAVGVDDLDASELIGLWSGSDVDRLPKAEAIQLCQLAEKLGFGLEPDPRFGGPALQSSLKVTAFPVSEDAPHVSSPEFTTALTLTHLAIAVSAADGRILEAETDTLFKHVESSLGLTSHERTRLEAHARWLGQSDVKLTGLTKRLAALSAGQRESLGRLLVDIAVVDGVVKPEEVRTIGKIYKLLGLDETAVTSRLHQAMTGSPALRDEPVIVRQAEQGQPGMPIPPRPAPEERARGFALDKASIDAKMRDTAAVSAMLANIFDEDSAPTVSGRRVASPPNFGSDAPVVPSSEQPTHESLAGLDPMHTQLFRQVTQNAELERAEFDALCEPLGLLPNGALDTLNEAAIEVCEEPLLDGDEHLTINPYALEEMRQ